MRISGAEFMKWFDDHWPGEDWYHDDSEIETHDDFGKWLLKPDELYDTADLGYVLYQGDDPSLMNENDTVTNHIKRWRKQRDFAVITVMVPKKDLAVALALLKEHEYKIMKTGGV